MIFCFVCLGFPKGFTMRSLKCSMLIVWRHYWPGGILPLLQCSRLFQITTLYLVKRCLTCQISAQQDVSLAQTIVEYLPFNKQGKAFGFLN